MEQKKYKQIKMELSDLHKVFNFIKYLICEIKYLIFELKEIISL
jgi:hypothetical protein